jgi:carboxylate-amine ligase
MRTVGVEEEMLLVDARTGVPVAVAGSVLEHDGAADSGGENESGESESPGQTVSAELQQQQIETDTKPSEQLSELAEQIRAGRRRAHSLAGESGARVVALGTSPLRVSPETTAKARYLAMAEHFGLTTLEQLTCGCHVHVSIQSRTEGVAVLDRIRPWLPVLLALSANSPFWQDADSGYASLRSQVWNRFPTAGPCDVLGSVTAYDDLVAALIGSGVALDAGMIYFDARLSAQYPTVEIRVADVCLYADDAVLIAALARALVETAARDWQSGRPAPAIPLQVLRAAGWRAGRSGLDGDLLHPLSGAPLRARTAITALLDHLRPALRDTGDLTLVSASVSRLLGRGTGATAQRATFASTGDLHQVVLEAADQTMR